MNRYHTELINKWHSSPRRKPLILRGARQVGKSTLVHIFARERQLELYEINLERHLNLNKVFKTLETERIVAELEAITQNKITDKGLLFLDEIQAVPEAIPALRYFYEEKPTLPIIAAGSLLEFALKDHNYSMPVGRIQYMHIEPMTFEEFLDAIQADYFSELVSNWTPNKIIPEQAHRKLLELQRIYMVSGGMPEAIAAYKETKKLQEATQVQREIVSTYIDDFAKYASNVELAKIQSIFQKIPGEVGNKIKYSRIDSEARANQTRAIIEMLSKARVSTQVFSSNCAGLPLQAGQDSNVFKLLYLDVGLMLNALGLDLSNLNNFDDRKLVNEGRLAEQFIGQHLLFLNSLHGDRNLHYWLREGKVGNAEVDFVISRRNAIIPIEVKAGGAGILKSLHQFVARKNSKFAVRFDLNPPSTQVISTPVAIDKNKTTDVTYTLFSLPLYLITKLDSLIETQFS